MTIKFIKNGNILDSKCAGLVCPVNSYGVMGAGLAKQFKNDPRFEESNVLYTQACKQGKVAPGSVLLFAPTINVNSSPSVVYFTTKDHWEDNSEMNWIYMGLINLYKTISYYNIDSVAIPAIGAGLGNLPWPTVEMAIKQFYQDISALKVREKKEFYLEVYEPTV